MQLPQSKRGEMPMDRIGGSMSIRDKLVLSGRDGSC